MYWTSFSDFLAMGNHGVYVWGSVIVMAIAMIVEPLLLISGQKSLVARLTRQLRAERLEQGAESAVRHSKGKH
jgi:heme exporter protein D